MSLSETLPTFNLGETQEPAFHNWHLSNFESYINPRVLVAGENLNSLADLLIDRNITFHLATSDTNILTQLQSKYTNNNAIRSIKQINLKHESFVEQYFTMLKMFGSVIYTKFIDNKDDLRSYLANISLLLWPGGHAFITFPTFNTPLSNSLISSDDLKLIDRQYLKPILHNFTILKLRHFRLATNDYAGLQYKELNYIATVIRKNS